MNINLESVLIIFCLFKLYFQLDRSSESRHKWTISRVSCQQEGQRVGEKVDDICGPLDGTELIVRLIVNHITSYTPSYVWCNEPTHSLQVRQSKFIAHGALKASYWSAVCNYTSRWYINLWCAITGPSAATNRTWGLAEGFVYVNSVTMTSKAHKSHKWHYLKGRSRSWQY